MKRRSLILMILIVLLPVGLLTWLSVRMARDEQSITEQRFRSLMDQRLDDVNRVIAARFLESEIQLQQITSIDDFSVVALREMVRSEPRVSQLFVLSPDGSLLYPNPSDALNGTELSFLQRAARMFTDRDLQNAVAQAEAGAYGDSSPLASATAPAAPPAVSSVAEQETRLMAQADMPVAVPLEMPPLLKQSAGEAESQMPAFLPANGWFVWYWDRGLNLIYWQRRPSGQIVGAALERSRWVADLISWLPETNAADSGEKSVSVNTAFRVLSSSAEAVYDWGGDIPKQAIPFCECPLAAPLASWRMQCFIPADQIAAGGGRSARLGFTAGIGAFALMLTAMAWLLFRDYSRDMREASQQVSFVNQVSHELKTPLTNIRLYADLLERDLEQVSSELTASPLRRLEVITSEAQRLSRLIGNVLTFAQQHRKTLQIQPMQVDVTALVRQIAERFAPSLANHGIEVNVEGPTGGLLWLDPDFVEQILGNLISNVEKYAAAGKQLTIRTTLTPQEAIIDVIDGGPGIAKTQRANLFLPFSRLSKDLRASTGTGIGLSISRELARLHGGDIVLKESAAGCWFQVHLKSQENPAQNKA